MDEEIAMMMSLTFQSVVLKIGILVKEKYSDDLDQGLVRGVFLGIFTGYIELCLEAELFIYLLPHHLSIGSASGLPEPGPR
jgi:hypothetical protein